MMNARTPSKTISRILVGASALFAMAAPGSVVAADKPDEGKAKGNPGTKPATKALCDDDWEGGFWTVEVNQLKNDGKVPSAKPYDPQKPREPWFAPEGQYIRMGYYGDPERRNKGLPANQIIKMLGRFYDRKEADAFLKKMYSDSALGAHMNPRYPPFVSSPGALLVSDKYTCTLNKENDTLRKATWIVEVDGRLFAGAETACKQGKKRKTVTVVDCAGEKTVVADVLDAPCGVSIRSCLYPLPDEAFALDHVYSEAGEGTSVVVRAYDLKKKQRVFSAEETNDGGPETVLMSVDDVDGDGVPEIVHRVAGTDKVVEKLKWRNRRYAEVK
jgi:hypothetical protein